MHEFDVTPTNESLYQEKRGWGETGIGGAGSAVRSFGETVFVELGRQVPVLKRQADSTATTAEVRAAPGQGLRRGPASEPGVLDPRDARLALLARKYEGSASVEDTARLQILTERLRKLSPRVTQDNVAQAAEMVARRGGHCGRLATMKAKLGLR
jgi:hypothetical protein